MSINTSQIMIKQSVRWAVQLYLILLLIALMETPLAKGFDDSEIRHIDHPGWFIESPFIDLDEALNKALRQGKKGLMLLFTTEGCSYCDLFIRSSLNKPEIALMVQNNFDSIGLEIFEDVEMTTPDGAITSVKQFAKKEGAEFSPTLLFYGIHGQKLLRLTGYQSPERFKRVMTYFSSDYYKSESLHDYLKRAPKAGSSHQNVIKTALKKDPMFESPPYMLDRSHFPAHQPLLVIFEKPDCSECNNLHSAVLTQNDIRETLKKFEIVRLNTEDNQTQILTPDGKRSSPASWYEQNAFTQFPAIAFYDERGNEVLKTDALVLHQRMMNSLNYVIEKAYNKDWTYQKFARAKAVERFKNKEKISPEARKD